MINKDVLQKYTNAFIMYELAEHNVDPRERLEGTTFRIERNNACEGYKYRVIQAWEKRYERIKQGNLSYVDALLDVLPGVNLVDYRQENNIRNKLQKTSSSDFEIALKDLFEGDDDESAFNEIVSTIGGSFDVVAFAFFLKNPDVYMPVRSILFEERLRVLGADIKLSGNCRWDVYQEYNQLGDEVKTYLKNHLNKDIRKIDAHSFLWIVPGLTNYIDSEVQLVEHTTYGKGVVVGFDRDLIIVKFGKAVKKFGKDDCFARGILKFLPLSVNVYGKKIESVDRETVEANEEADNELIDDLRNEPQDDVTFEYVEGSIEPPEMTEVKGKSVPARNRQVAWNALVHAGYRCEVDPEHRTFIRRFSEIPYTEPHHLIPLAFQKQFDVSLDREQNIVSLCSNCHNQIHYGRDHDILLEKLYREREDLLKSIGIDISLEVIKQMYSNLE